MITGNLQLAYYHKDSENNSNEQVSLGFLEGISLNAKHEFPIWGFPSFIQEFIQHIADVRQVPREFVVAPLLSATSIAIGNKAKVATDGYINPLSVWCMVVAPSGSNKSQPTKDIMKRILEYNKELHKDYVKELKEYESNPYKDSLPEPAYKQLTIQDCTPEYRNQALADNPNGLLLYRDELSGMIHDIGRYGSSGEVEQLLTIFDGGQIQCNRKTQKQLLIENPFLTIIGGIQPSILRQTLNNDRFTNSGFLPRFLLFYPNQVENHNRIRMELDEKLMERWSDRIKSLYEMPPLNAPMQLSAEAEDVYTTLFNRYSALQNETECDYRKAVLSKLKILVLRLSALCQMLHCAEGGTTEISGDVMRWATYACDYFANAQIKAYENIYGTTQKKLTRKDVFRQLVEWYPDSNKAKVAEGLGIAKQTLYEFLK